MSRCGAARRVSIPPDLATCPECLGEVLEPDDRRHRYPFTNCTQCGPRYTIARDVPYDRSRTTMSRFTMCPQCSSEAVRRRLEGAHPVHLHREVPPGDEGLALGQAVAADAAGEA